MKTAILILGALIVLLLTAVIPLPGGLNANVIYYSPVFMFLLAVLSGCTVWCCVRRTFRSRQIGFFMVHLGVVTILVGAFVGYIAGSKGAFRLSLMPKQSVGQVLTSAGDPVRFGFNLSAENFQVKFYPPTYRLYRQLPPEEVVSGQMPYEKAGEFSANDQGICMIDGVGADSNLWNASTQKWVQHEMLPDGSVLSFAAQTPSFFGVTLIFDGEKHLVSINHPAQFKGWRFYLMSYDQNNQRFVQLSARHDPGRLVVIAGIWLTIAGTFIFCFRKQGGLA